MAFELLYLPHWLVVYETVASAANVAGRVSVRGSSDPLPPKAAKATCRPPGRLPSDGQFHASSSVGSGEQLAVLVCRLSGQAAHIRLDGLEVAPGPATLQPALQPAEAEERAADFAGRVLLVAARGKRRRERGRLLRSEACGYPYWVEYVERGSNVDFRAVDAVSGKRAGAAVRTAIARGITASRQERARQKPGAPASPPASGAKRRLLDLPPR